MSSDRSILIFTVVMTVLMAAVSYLNSHDWSLVLFIIPLVASATYWSMLFSRRLTRRFAPPPPSSTSLTSPPRPEPTTERPEHAQRRRTRRRQRGRRGPGSNSG